MVVNDALILKLQDLAKLELSRAEKETMKVELEKIIEMFDTISNVDTGGIEPLIYLSDTVNNLRDDNPGESLPVEVFADMAPAFINNFVAVPKVIES